MVLNLVSAGTGRSTGSTIVRRAKEGTPPREVPRAARIFPAPPVPKIYRKADCAGPATGNPIPRGT
eukprot:SAG31_NODE_16109_length_722_cov_1.255217_1_plen_65_part_01